MRDNEQTRAKINLNFRRALTFKSSFILGYTLWLYS